VTNVAPAVTVIIPTLGLRERADSLRAAIRSVQDQAGVSTTVIVVLNGSKRDPKVERELRDNVRITLVVRDAGGIPAALAAGREQVRTQWFASLDDDDLYLQNALLRRVRALEKRPDCAAAFTNGYIRTGMNDVLHVKGNRRIGDDPVHAMLDGNWCLPGSWLCRSAMVGGDVFDDMPNHLECTYFALRIATEHPIEWIDAPTVVYNVGSPSADSQSRAFVLGQVRALRRIVQLDLPLDVRHAYRMRIASAYHSAAEHERRAGALLAACRWHVGSLLQPAGWRYMLFTRHLLRDALRVRT
jgi:glycosyltransferase involved in cell wall biosynthesis